MNSSIRISHCTFWKKRAILSTDSRDYTDASQPVLQKTAYVYLPYGYDEADQETRYNILYLMHGWTMTAGDFFDETRSGIVPMLDHMIESGDIPPLIVVCATFDAENQSQSFSRSVDELSVFHHDLRENLMPCVESRFHTYAEDVTPEAFQASRAHRAFGGFSLGAVTTWYQFIYNLDFIQYFLPMSSDCWIMGTYLWYYFDVQLRQIFGYWALGVALSAVFQRYVPEDLMTAAFGGNEAFGVLMAATVGVPLYACGGGTIPLLQAWLMDGMSLGSAAAFMITGPSTKITNLGALKIVLGLKNFVIYIGFVMAFSFLTGLVVNLLV